MRELYNCDDFLQYIGLLKESADKYCIIVAVKDAVAQANGSVSFNHPKKIFDAFQQIGFNTNLYGSFRKSYIGVIRGGKAIFEWMGNFNSEPVFFKDGTLEVVSAGFSCGNFCSIRIDGFAYATNDIGLNIVVWDDNTQMLVDSVAVNMLRENIVIVRNMVELSFAAKLAEKRNVLGINSHIFFFGEANDVNNPSEWEKTLIDVHDTGSIIARNVDKYYRISGMDTCFTSIDEFKEHLKRPVRVIPYNGYLKHAYIQSRYLNVGIDGTRFVTDVPACYDYTVHIFGSSVGLIWEIKDEDVMSSQLQKLLSNARIKNYCVAGMTLPMICKYIDAVEFSPDDFVIIFIQKQADQPLLKAMTTRYDIPVTRLYSHFDRPHDYGEVFFDRIHPNHNAMKVIAAEMYKAIPLTHKSKNNRKDIILVPSQIEKSEFDTPLQEFLSTLRPLRKHIGSIVVNCNPFTLGHRHLIETASKLCWHLYIFVVEEDKSVFPFTERLALVSSGVADLQNVTVLASGKFIISQFTFAEYFEKSDIQDTLIDPSFDIELFSKYICPTLGISVRFAGEEPLDKVTLQYNQTMARILPQHGIEFVEIPRKETGGTVISASRVRTLLKENNFEEIKKIVPQTTFSYLMEKYGKSGGGVIHLVDKHNVSQQLFGKNFIYMSKKLKAA